MDAMVRDDEAFEMTLDDIIRLQEAKKNKAQSNGGVLSNVNVSGTGGNRDVVKALSSSLDDIVESRLNRNSGGGPTVRCSFDIGDQTVEMASTVGDESTAEGYSSVFDEYACVPYNYPLSTNAAGVSITERQHGLAPNKHANPNNNRHLRKNNQFKPYQYFRYCKGGSCSMRCRAQARLIHLEAKLRAQRGVATNGSHCSCPSGQFQHRSRSQSREPPNRFRPQYRNRSCSRSRSKSRNRNRSRSRRRSQSRNRMYGNPVILFRKDQIFNADIADGLKSVKEQRANRTPMTNTNLHCAEQLKPLIHHTFMSMTTRFSGYYV